MSQSRSTRPWEATNLKSRQGSHQMEAKAQVPGGCWCRRKSSKVKEPRVCCARAAAEGAHPAWEGRVRGLALLSQPAVLAPSELPASWMVPSHLNGGSRHSLTESHTSPFWKQTHFIPTGILQYSHVDTQINHHVSS